MAMVNQTNFIPATVAKQLKYQCIMSSIKLKYKSMNSSQWRNGYSRPKYSLILRWSTGVRIHSRKENRKV